MPQAQPQRRKRPKRKRTWRKRRPGDPRHYSVTIVGEGHWQPSKSLRELGFRNVACGPDGLGARALAEQCNRAAHHQKAVADAARSAEQFVRADSENTIFPYEMLRAWSQGNAARLQHLSASRWGSPAGKFEESLKLQTDQTQRPLSPMRLQTRPVPWWRKWLLR